MLYNLLGLLMLIGDVFFFGENNNWKYDIICTEPAGKKPMKDTRK